jgi:hypothetical protein
MSSKPENKLLGNAPDEENDKHPGVCGYGQLCSWKNKPAGPKDEVNAIFCGGCAYFGMLYNGEVIRCFHAIRFLWCGLSRDKKKFAMAIRPKKGGKPLISVAHLEDADGIRYYFKCVLKLEELPEPGTDDEFDRIDVACKMIGWDSANKSV